MADYKQDIKRMSIITTNEIWLHYFKTKSKKYSTQLYNSSSPKTKKKEKLLFQQEKDRFILLECGM